MEPKKPNLIDIFQQTLADVMSKEEFLAAFKNVVERIKRFEAKLTDDFSNLVKAINAKVDVKLAAIKEGSDGRDGKDGAPGPKGDKGDKGDMGPTGLAIFGGQGAPGKDGSPDTAQQVRDKLELLTGDERLKMEAIRGLEALIADIKTLQARPTVSPGRSLLQLYVNGAKKGAIQYLNITGSGVSYNNANGRNDVTITGSGGSLSVLTATGTVDDSNTTFTFVSEPTIVNVNGASYVHGHGVTISSTTATLDNPAGVGNFVYGLG